MSVAPSGSLRASALSFVLLAVGHTIGGRQWTSEKVFKAITNSRPWACGTVGWYQYRVGTQFPLNLPDISTNPRQAILHYQWSRDPAALNDPLTKAMAGIINILLWTSSAWYAKHGINENAWAVGLSAALQAYAAFKS
ncbi:hypothetical protein N7478_002502 [Penicillium angulare]|uniref:uncharacterized protein n=1 Tax=Penicillium angulare TaxID=116970 RepID=UPI00253F7522|nr:uncharacterized protein N7478_002502 [Penicillium angulare]KAJ5286816.1 hypothetical protein N7478_002502 [Penicillium angulare]